MATFSQGAVRLLASAVAPPIMLSFNKSLLAESQPEEKEDAEVKKNVIRACNLPLNDHVESERVLPPSEMYPRNAVEEQIGVARKTLWEMGSTFMSQVELVSNKVNTGIELTKSTVDFIQNNPEDLPRVVLICVAGMGGVVLGYRGGIFRKIAYSTLAMGSMATLCYPKKTIEMTHVVSDEIGSFWEEIGGKDLVAKVWPFEAKTKEEEPILESPAKPTFQLASDELLKKTVKKDSGQSNPRDKDMYSTRGS